MISSNNEYKKQKKKKLQKKNNKILYLYLYYYNIFNILKFFQLLSTPIENFSLIKHKLDFAYFLHHYKLFND